MDRLLPEAVRTDQAPAVVAPVNFEPFRDQYLTITTDPASPTASSFLQALVLRALASLPPGKTQITVIDPQGFGTRFRLVDALGGL